MMLPQLLALAASASAFLVVPQLAQPDEPEGTFKALPVAAINDITFPPSTQSHTVKVPCAQCHGEDATLTFDIEVRDENRLLFNGFEVFPNPDPISSDLKAEVASVEAGSAKEELTYILTQQVVDVDEKQGMMVVEVSLGVGEVGTTKVHGVQLKATVIVSPSWELYIADVQVPELSAKPECEGLWCRLQELWGEVSKGGMGCHRGHGAHHGGPPKALKDAADAAHRHGVPPPKEHGHEHPHPHPHPHPHHPHYGHDGKHPHPHHHYGKLVRNLASHIFLPVIMGITAGVGVAVLAMVACSAVVRLASALGGRAFRDPWAFPAEIVIIDEEHDEKSGLVSGQSPPPQYEAPVEKS